jgi:hypothetical protein
MKFTSRRSYLCIAVAPFVVASSIHAGDSLVIGGFDAARAGQGSIPDGSLFDDVRASITGAYRDAAFTGAPALTSQFLAGIDILILNMATGCCSTTTPLSAAEQDALRVWIDNGGSAAIYLDNDSYAGAGTDLVNESVLDPFGLDITGTGAAWPQTTTVVNPRRSQVSNGPFGLVTSWSVGWSGWFNTVPAEANVLANVNQSGLPGLVVFERHTLAACSGVVVLYSDSTALVDGFYGPGTANEKLLLNTIAYISQPSCDAGLCGDIDASGEVDGGDLGLLLGAWDSTDTAADLNGDGIVDGADLGILLGNWGPCAEQ